LCTQSSLDIRGHFIHRPNRHGNRAPQFLIQADLGQSRQMPLSERLQAHVQAFERHRETAMAFAMMGLFYGWPLSIGERQFGHG
jgi:hypothetical protein